MARALRPRRSLQQSSSVRDARALGAGGWPGVGVVGELRCSGRGFPACGRSRGAVTPRTAWLLVPATCLPGRASTHPFFCVKPSADSGTDAPLTTQVQKAVGEVRNWG